MISRKCLSRVVLAVLASNVIILLFLAGASFAFWHFRALNHEYSITDTNSDVHVHRYYRTNPFTGESASGFVDIYDEFYENREETLSNFYIDKEGFYNLISSFESTEYVCTGSCYCSSSRRTVSGIHTFKSRVIYLVAALSSVVAYNKAEKYFEDRCGKFGVEECNQNEFVLSEVEECSPVEKDDVDESSNEEESKPKKGSYVCTGQCVKLIGGESHAEEMFSGMGRGSMLSFVGMYSSLQSQYNCDAMKLTKTYTKLDFSEEKRERIVEEVKKLKQDVSDGREMLDMMRNDYILELGEDEFLVHFTHRFIEDLDEFCIRKSSKSVSQEFKGDKLKDGETGEKLEDNMLVFCRGVKKPLEEREVKFYQALNPSLRCIKH